MKPVVRAWLGAVLLFAGDVPAQLLTAAAAARAIGAPAKPLLAVIRMPDRHPVLTRLDPLSLEPVGREVEVGEYHYAWSVSPDGSQLAVAVGGRGIGIRILDLTEMTVVRDVQTNIATEALGWLTPGRLLRSECPAPFAGEAPAGRACSSLRRMLWLGDESSFAVFGEDLLGEASTHVEPLPGSRSWTRTAGRFA